MYGQEAEDQTQTQSNNILSVSGGEWGLASLLFLGGEQLLARRWGRLAATTMREGVKGNRASPETP